MGMRFWVVNQYCDGYGRWNVSSTSSWGNQIMEIMTQHVCINNEKRYTKWKVIRPISIMPINTIATEHVSDGKNEIQSS